MNRQFEIKSGDKITWPDYDPFVLIAALLDIELRHPGLIIWMLRTMAVVNDDFHCTVTTDSVERSIEAQNSLKRELDKAAEAFKREKEGVPDGPQ